MKKILSVCLLILVAIPLFAQQFEEQKIAGTDFDKFKTTVGGDFALQYQSLKQHADGIVLMPIGSGINLPTANLNMDADLAPGMRVHLRTYLSARHHNEAWVKGGFLLLDELSFLNSSGIDRLMQYLTLKVGVMEVNYGDGHFRRSDNAAVLNNHFVENYIMDAFTTAPAIEAMFRNNGWIAMLGITDGNLKPELVGFANNQYVKYHFFKELAAYAKFGFDKQLNEEIRLRLTVSPWLHSNSRRGTLYNGDRAGARYYSILVPASAGQAGTDIKSNFTNSRWGPGSYTENNSVMVNLFAKYKSLEFFGLYENARGKASGNEYKFNQYSFEGLIRFGKKDQFYGAARYNVVSNQSDMEVDRIQVSGGWFWNPNVLMKLEYVKQNYSNFVTYGGGAGFNGLMLEAAISF
jgi:hypothetical protein